MDVSLMTAYVAEPTIMMRITSTVMYRTVFVPNLAMFSRVIGLALGLSLMKLTQKSTSDLGCKLRGTWRRSIVLVLRGILNKFLQFGNHACELHWQDVLCRCA